VVAKELANVTELGHGGSVPELRFENNAEKPVLLIDGEELIGAKQNRVLNLTILVPAKQTIVIPVTCVESGRWRMATPKFKSADHVMYSRGRAAKCSQVTESMRASGTYRSDQTQVWREIAGKAIRFGTKSPTGAMAAMYERNATLIEEFVRAFAWAERQAGVTYAIDGQFWGLDLFDYPTTLHRLFPRLVRSYALDALDSNGCEPTMETREAALDVLKSVSNAQAFSNRAVGLGKDIRIRSNEISGSALWANGRYIHISAFKGGGGIGESTFHPRISRPTLRRS
jgi:ARG and Rhodanese-Phosphatase-superfamily-associated Protein domain